MNRAGENFLSGPGFAGDEDSRGPRRDPCSLLERIVPLGRVADDGGMGVDEVVHHEHKALASTDARFCSRSPTSTISERAKSSTRSCNPKVMLGDVSRSAIGNG